MTLFAMKIETLKKKSRNVFLFSTPGNERLHCTMVRTEFDSRTGSPCFTLFLEFLGGLVPLLKGRRISKLRPEFVIYDPKTEPKSENNIKTVILEMDL